MDLNIKIISSSPGKVLISGGYLILERPMSGIVFSVTSRFYSQLAFSASSDQTKQKYGIFHVLSPQFDSFADFQISPDLKNEESFTISQTKENPFVKNAILAVFLFSKQYYEKNKNLKEWESLAYGNFEIVIKGDNSFYSMKKQLENRNLPLTSKNLSGLPKFIPLGDDLKNLTKTGLGSSATLTSSFICSLLIHFKIISKNSFYWNSEKIEEFNKLLPNYEKKREEDLRILHNITQFAHCLAQGKIGSGFDVSSAIYGSQKYTRFSPDLIQPLLTSNPTKSQLFKICSSEWDNQVTTLKLTKGLRLFLGDVCQGSSTPVMVKKVLEWWHTKKEESSVLITELNNRNKLLEAQFRDLEKIENDNPQQFTKLIQKYSSLTFEEWKLENTALGQLLVKIRENFTEIRKFLKEIGKKANVEIEPEPQSQLIDQTTKIPGILISGVPGAGGNDALFVIFLESSSVEQNLENLWEKNGIVTLPIEETHCGIEVQILEENDENEKNEKKILKKEDSNLNFYAIAAAGIFALGFGISWYYKYLKY